ncbi:hypothetical protein CAAN1_01S12684 [[Candida] anglica]|uniref:BED-type domain-containing protein n=1 Tax=[Candida] anglica TaxID=148631 RepID=A0ABP0EPU6_9ASCO
MSYYPSNGNPLTFPSYSQNRQAQQLPQQIPQQIPQQQPQQQIPQQQSQQPQQQQQQQQQPQQQQQQPQQPQQLHQQTQPQQPQAQQPQAQQPQQSPHTQVTTTAQPQLENTQQPQFEEKVIVVKKERKNRPGQRFGAKKKSWVWSWFVQDAQDANIAACDFCGKVITRLSSDKGSPKKLSEHLKTHKLTKESINSTRPIPIDGNGITYAPNGMPMSYVTNYSGHSTDETDIKHKYPTGPPTTATSSANTVSSGTSMVGAPGSSNNAPPSSVTSSGGPNSINSLNFDLNRRYGLGEFENSQYTAMKFHKHIMSFLTENKLSISVIKSHSFKQLVYDLKPDSVADVKELTTLYSSLLEVSRFENNSSSQINHIDVPTTTESNMVNTLARVVEKGVSSVGGSLN